MSKLKNAFTIAASGVGSFGGAALIGLGLASVIAPPVGLAVGGVMLVGGYVVSRLAPHASVVPLTIRANGHRIL